MAAVVAKQIAICIHHRPPRFIIHTITINGIPIQLLAVVTLCNRRHIIIIIQVVAGIMAIIHHRRDDCQEV
jgi:hypothetical protein